MKSGDAAQEFVKYVFSEEEKKEISSRMAQKVSELQTSEDDKKAIMSDFKSRIDSIQAEINRSATQINNGYEMRNVDCYIKADYDSKLWISIREDTGEIAKERKMTVEDMQRQFDD